MICTAQIHLEDHVKPRTFPKGVSITSRPYLVERLAESDGMPLGEYDRNGSIYEFSSRKPFVVLDQSGHVIEVGYQTLKDLRTILGYADVVVRECGITQEVYEAGIKFKMARHARKIKKARIELVRKLIRRAHDRADAKIPVQKPCPFPVWKTLYQSEALLQTLFLATVAELGFPKGERWGKVQTKIRTFGALCEKASVELLCEQLKKNPGMKDFSFYVPNEGLLHGEYGYHIFLFQDGQLSRAQFRHPHADMPLAVESANDIRLHPNMKLLFIKTVDRARDVPMESVSCPNCGNFYHPHDSHWGACG